MKNARQLGILLGLVAVIVGGAIAYLRNSNQQSRDTVLPTAQTTSSSTAISRSNDSDWRAKLDQLAPSGKMRGDKTKQIAELLRSVPPDARAAAARAVLQLAPDKDSKSLTPLVRDRNLPKEVNQILFTDLMSRTESVKLPVLAEIADTPGDSHHDEAVATLQNAIGSDGGQDTDWEAAVQRYFQQAEVKAREDVLKLKLMKAQQN